MRGSGYTLASSPLLENVALAWQTLRALGPDGSEYADRIGRGEISATLAVAERSGRRTRPSFAPRQVPVPRVGR